MKISLAMIVKNEVEDLAKCLRSVCSYVDEMVVVNTGDNPKTTEIILEYGAKEFKYEWNNNFADARNFAFSKVETELVLWLDADDTLEGAENLPNLIKRFEDSRLGALWMYYDYDQDEYGNTTMVVWRERILRKDWFKWSGALHEEALKQVDCIQSKIPKETMYVRHHPAKDRIARSAVRNLEISSESYVKDHEEGTIDPFNVWNYARSLNAVGYIDEAAEAFEEFIALTSSDEHRYQALSTLSDIYRKTRRYDFALDTDLQAIKVRPKWSTAYFNMAKTYFVKEDFDNVILYTELGFKMDNPGDDVPVPFDPLECTYRPLEPLAYALFQKARFEEAFTCVKKALQYKPDNKYFLNWAEIIPQAIENRDIEKACIDIFKYMDANEPELVKPFIECLPKPAKDWPEFVHLRNKLKGYRDGSNKVIIYCGSSYDLWDAKSEHEGIGGSEEAVINISRELAKQGWEVEVYNNCLDEGVYDGVLWQGIWKYDSAQPARVFIGWRDTRSIELAPRDSHCVLWLHDVCSFEHFTPNQLERVDKIFVLSEWHRTCLPEIQDDKFWYTTNGIKVSQFKEKVKRNPYACIYASSPDRGLDRVLDAWPRIKEEVPEAELHVFYGFTKVYDEIHKNNQGMKAFKEKIMKQLEQPGITYYGMVPHKELAEWMLYCGLWLYPSSFTEISCITAMKAQAAGCIPITTTVAALDQTVQFGEKLDGFDPEGTMSQEKLDTWEEKVIDYLKNTEFQDDIRDKMMHWAQLEYDWAEVGKKWSDYFREDK
jgi:glycosyltransferase involved in cell wall biosynthesis